VVAWRNLAGFVQVAIAGMMFGCSSKEDPLPPAPNPCAEQGCSFPYATFDGSTPTVSLRRDLLANQSDKPGGGVLRRACAAGPCHDADAEADLFISQPLRDPRTQNEIPLAEDDVRRLLGSGDGVLRPSKTARSMPIVDPGNPQNSFLMRKIDNCYEGINDCTPLKAGATHACGSRMPELAEPLCADERDMIRRWIAQGATDGG
jgi:hypothetical protein